MAFLWGGKRDQKEDGMRERRYITAPVVFICPTASASDCRASGRGASDQMGRLAGGGGAASSGGRAGEATAAAALRFLLALAVVYAALSAVAYRVLHMHHVSPLGLDAPADAFSEARAVEHVRRLTVDIPSRQEGQPGLEAAAQYIKAHIKKISEHAGPEFRIEVEDNIVSGSLSMLFLRHRVTLAYRNHKNIVMRVSSSISEQVEPSFLLNAHYDSPLGSPGAGDCGSCVASLLELARVMIDSKWVPGQPIIFLFNGAEEVFLLGSHGFMTTHKWRSTVGAFINLEASGTGGIDLVVQSGPGYWPTHVYAQSAKVPMANSVAQEVFDIIPGDTDYRILAKDFGNIPGLDIIFMFGGYFYHTSYDTLENLIPGSLQARGDNLFSLIKAFTNSSLLSNERDEFKKDVGLVDKGSQTIFLDYLTWFMVVYSHDIVLVLHNLPLAIFLVILLILGFRDKTSTSFILTFLAIVKGICLHASGLILAFIISILAAVTRLLLTKNAMNWFAHPYLAFLMFTPSSLIGLLLPRSMMALSEEACFWGAFGFYALITAAYIVLGHSGGFLTCFMSASMLIGRFVFHLCTKRWSRNSLKSQMAYVVAFVPCFLYCLYNGGFLLKFVIEKTGMMGSLPPPYGHFVPDIIVSASVAQIVVWLFGPLVPVAGHMFTKSFTLQFLMQTLVVTLALSSQFFPYSTSAPKRVVFQHTILTTDANKVSESSFDFSVVDANPLSFVFENAPEAAKWLKENSEFSFDENHLSERRFWLALYPISFLSDSSYKFPAQYDEIVKHYPCLPYLSLQKPATILPNGHRRVHLELSLGSLSEIWSSVLNITGPLSNWSFADSVLPAPEAIPDGPPSYICRLTGKSSENWTFWLEANSSAPLRIDVAVLDQYLVDDAKKLKSLFPGWADLVAFSTFFSTYLF